MLTAPANEREMMPLTATAAIDLGALPSGPCPGCGGGLWWRVSVLSGGPNPWLCRRCEWPNPAAWLDGHAVGAAGSRPECDLYRLRIAATAPYACNERQPLQRNGTPRRGRRDRGAQPRALDVASRWTDRHSLLAPAANLPGFRAHDLAAMASPKAARARSGEAGITEVVADAVLNHRQEAAHCPHGNDV